MDKQTAAVVLIVAIVATIGIVAAIYMMTGGQEQAAVQPYAQGVGVPNLECSMSDRTNWSIPGHYEANTSSEDNLTLENTFKVKNTGSGPTQNQVNVRAVLDYYPTNGDDDVTITLTPESGVYANKVSDTLYVLQQLASSSSTGMYVGYSAEFDVEIEFDTTAPDGVYVVSVLADTLYTPLTYSYYSTQGVSQCGASMVINVDS